MSRYREVAKGIVWTWGTGRVLCVVDDEGLSSVSQRAIVLINADALRADTWQFQQVLLLGGNKHGNLDGSGDKSLLFKAFHLPPTPSHHPPPVNAKFTSSAFCKTST